jgi:hypothetical protein
MKKVFLLSVCMLAVWLLMSCGEKKENYVYEKDGYTITFAAPKGFFTQTSDRKEYIRGFMPGQTAYVSETFTMQISLPGCTYSLEMWERNRESDKDKPLYQKIEMAGVHGTSVRHYLLPRIRYSMLGEIGKTCIDIDFSPNDIKNLEWEEYENNRDAHIQKCTELSTNKELLAIMKSVKITKK